MFMDKLGILPFRTILNPKVGLSFAEEGGTGDAGTETSWMESLELEDGVKNHPSLSSFKNVSDVVKSYVAVQPLIGREKIPLPRKDDKGNYLKEDMDIVYDRLGRPKTADEYKLPEDIKLPEGYPAISPDKLKQLKTIAHETGMLPGQLSKLYDWYMRDSINEYQQFLDGREKSRVDVETKLRKEWGRAYDEKMALAKKTFNSFADDEGKQMFEEGLGNDPRIIRLFASIGAKMSEDGISEGKHAGFTLSPEEAQAEIAKIQGDRKHPYYSKLHPEHDIAVKRMQDLHEMAYPEKA